MTSAQMSLDWFIEGKSAPHSCPLCGGSIEKDRASAGIYSYSASTGFTVRGLPLPKLQRLGGLLGAIMKARGSIVSNVDLAAIIGSAAADQGGLIAVRMTALRRDLKLIGGGWPFKRVYREGWRWTGPIPRNANGLALVETAPNGVA